MSLSCDIPPIYRVVEEELEELDEELWVIVLVDFEDDSKELITGKLKLLTFFVLIAFLI